MSLQHVPPGDDRSARQAVYEAFADRNRPVEEAIAQALDAGIDRLSVSIGFLTEITDDRQTITTVQTTEPADSVAVGDSCPLDQAYCRQTVRQDSPLCVQDAVTSSDVSEVAYETFGLDTYIGAKVVTGDDVHGTVCFADTEPRPEPFPEADQLFVELLARLVGGALERREYEETLTAQNERLRTETERAQRIADTTFDLLFRITPDTQLTYVSSGLHAILGYDPADAIGTSFTEYIAPQSVPAAVDAFERLLDAEPVRNLELTAETATDESAVIEVNATPIVEDGTVEAVQGVARDVTTRRAREAELRLKTRAIDDATVGVTIADATREDNPLIYLNHAFEELTGYAADEVLGRNCRFLQGPATGDERVETLRAGIDAGEPVSVDLVNYRANGAPFWNNVRVVPVEGEAGDPSHFVGFQEDATDRVRTQRLIELLNRVLRHNLRNNLNVLSGYGELLSDPDADADTTANAGRVVRETVAKLTSVSEQVRELEAIARQEREPTRLDVADLLYGVVADVEANHPDATVDVHVDVATDRGICAGVELERAVEELVDNALTHDADPSPRVRVSARDIGDAIVLTVADDGPGIPPVEASAVEAGRETTIEHGDGLGLWLVNWIVTRYGGSFQLRPAVDADEASGTVATVRLPSIEAEQSVDDAVRPHTTLFQ
ncbi:PAS domain S-box protein [Salinigranum halophilum]|uniref:PAS domain S-box protein n=1 Tax=Salinigranum halophilum TaxID=2565931 RepID=UPI0010A7613F|nr:PAS domain-containing protein [Salinigranum halophilum]